MKKSKPYITGEDRIQVKVRNPANGKFISKTFKYTDHNGKEGAIEASKKWSEEVQKLIDEKNTLDGIPTKPRKQQEPEKKLLREIESKKSLFPQDQLVAPVPMMNPPVIPLDPITHMPLTSQPQLDKKPFPYKSWIGDKTGSSLVLMAKSKAGKTSFLHQIVKSLPKDIIKIVISPNIHTSIYDSMRNKCVFSPIFDSRIIKLCQKINQRTKNHYRFVIIMDDVIDEKSNSSVLKMFLTLRNSNISAILSVQSVFLVNKMIRGNANYVLLGKLSGEEAILDTYKKFLVNYKSDLKIKHESDIVPTYDSLTKDYEFIFLNNLKEKVYLTNKDLSS
jgi:hypothetical protein